jgi:hypothetical protein
MIRQPHRAAVGYCPECRRVVIVENDGGTWPLVVCRCGWRSGLDGIDRMTLLAWGSAGEGEGGA